MKTRAITVNVLPEEYTFIQTMCQTYKMKRAEVLRGLINRAMRTNRFRPDKLFNAEKVKLTAEERAILNKKYNLRIYSKGRLE